LIACRQGGTGLHFCHGLPFFCAHAIVCHRSCCDSVRLAVVL
jgi:hypothetical protein